MAGRRGRYRDRERTKIERRSPEIGRANMRTLVELAGLGKLRPRISHRFSLEQAADAIQVVIDRKVIGKAVLVG